MLSTGRSSRKFSMAVHAYNLKGGAPVNFQWPIENAIYNLIYPMYHISPIYLIYLNEIMKHGHTGLEECAKLFKK